MGLVTAARSVVERSAAIDIGSNSVRMEVAEIAPDSSWKLIASDRRSLRIGDGVFRTGYVSGAALEDLCSLLAEMARVCEELEVSRVRAVATAAFREAGNQAEFLERTSRALGCPVEIISGEEEARLIHAGVESFWPNPGGRRLIVDVGGGSTELVLSESGRMERVVSLPLGALRESSIGSIHGTVAAVAADFTEIDMTIGTSATAAAVVAAAHGIHRQRREDPDRMSVTTSGIRSLYERLVRMTLAERRVVPGIGPQRAEIIVPGTAILLGVLEALKVPEMHYSAAGVLAGILADF